MPQLRPRPTVPSSRGFTLVELMVVVVIIGILSALAVPKFIAITGENQLDGDANALYQDLLWARTTSIKVGKHFRVIFGSSTIEGTNRFSWDIYEVDASGDIGANPVRKGVAGVGVIRGILPGSAYGGSRISSAHATVVAAATVANLGDIDGSGMQAGTADVVCKNASSETWLDGVELCGGTVGDLETGGIHLYSSRSNGRAYAIVFDRSKNLQPKRLRWMGGQWEVL